MVVQGRVCALSLDNFFPEQSPLAQYFTAVYYIWEVFTVTVSNISNVLRTMPISQGKTFGCMHQEKHEVGEQGS